MAVPTRMTGKHPKKESERMAPARGTRLREPRKMLAICAASMLSTLYSLIK
jgi:hypothetical protein